ncbi:MAG: sigma factor-like helix-turn-helix DNA-binding protein [Solirubrobacteraceae bacterium]
MTRIDELPPDQRAVLSLVLRRGKHYGEISRALDIGEDEVRRRAHDALDALMQDSSPALGAPQRARIADFLLGQLDPAERLVAYDEIEGSAAARAHAATLSDRLAQLAGGRLDGPVAPPPPERPPAVAGPAVLPVRDPRAPPVAAASRREPPAAPARPPRTAPARHTLSDAVASIALAWRRLRSRERTVPRASQPGSPAVSRAGGAALLAIIAIGVVVAILVTALSSEGPATRHPAGANAAGESQAAGSAGGGTSATGTTASTQGKLDATIRLSAPAGGKATGGADVGTVSGRYELAIAAERLAPTNGFNYVVWLYNSATQFEALGRAPAVGSNGVLPASAVSLPSSAGTYRQLIVTREPGEHPTHPGEIVLQGAFRLH